MINIDVKSNSIRSIELDNKIGIFTIVDIEFFNEPFFKLYYNELQQGAVFNYKTNEGKQKFKSCLQKNFFDEEVEQIINLLNKHD